MTPKSRWTLHQLMESNGEDVLASLLSQREKKAPNYSWETRISELVIRHYENLDLNSPLENILRASILLTLLSHTRLAANKGLSARLQRELTTDIKRYTAKLPVTFATQVVDQAEADFLLRIFDIVSLDGVDPLIAAIEKVRPMLPTEVISLDGEYERPGYAYWLSFVAPFYKRLHAVHLDGFGYASFTREKCFAEILRQIKAGEVYAGIGRSELLFVYALLVTFLGLREDSMDVATWDAVNHECREYLAIASKNMPPPRGMSVSGLFTDMIWYGK